MFSVKQSGFSVVEVVIAASILLALVVAISASLQAFVTLSRHTTDVTQATLLVEEGGEALLLMRDIDWEINFGNTELDTVYNLYWNGTSYVLSTSSVAIDGLYRREVVFDSVSRDNDGILDENGDVDTNTLKAAIAVYRVTDNKLLSNGNSLLHNTYAE